MLKGLKIIYFTSDEHFFHNNIIKYCNRPFKDYKEMNSEILKIFDILKDDDICFHLGDISASLGNNKETLKEMLKPLKGKHILIRGNHDHDISIFKHIGWEVYNYFILNLKTLDKDLGISKTYMETLNSLNNLNNLNNLNSLKNSKSYKDSIFLCHYSFDLENLNKIERAFKNFYDKKDFKFLIHGHLHGRISKLKDRFNVCYDVHKRLISLDEILNLKKF